LLYFDQIKSIRDFQKHSKNTKKNWKCRCGIETVDKKSIINLTVRLALRWRCTCIIMHEYKSAQL